MGLAVGQAGVAWVQAVPPAQVPAIALWVSNSPENLTGPLPLLHAQLPAQGCVRLMYHHKNVSPVPLEFLVWLGARYPGTQSAVWAVLGTSGPNPGEAKAGQLAAEKFLVGNAQGTGVPVRLSGGQFLTVVYETLPPKYTTSGLVEFRTQGDAPVDVYVEAVVGEGRRPVPSGAAFSLPLAKDFLFAAERVVPVTYALGGPWGFVDIGRSGEPSLLGTYLLKGNYGVVYRIQCSVANPTGFPQSVELACYFGGGGGYFEGLFDGALLATDYRRAGEEVSLRQMVVPAWSTLNCTLVTLPVSGCFYPVTLIVRPVR